MVMDRHTWTGGFKVVVELSGNSTYLHIISWFANMDFETKFKNVCIIISSEAYYQQSNTKGLGGAPFSQNNFLHYMKYDTWTPSTT